jgi:hypothetical protein
VPSRNYFIRQATTLLNLARQTRDPGVAASLLEKAASLTEQVEVLPSPGPDLSPRAPDVERASEGRL